MKKGDRDSSFFIEWNIRHFSGNLLWWGLLQSWWRKLALWTLNEPAEWALEITYKTNGKSWFRFHDDSHHKNGNLGFLLWSREERSGHIGPTAVHRRAACSSWDFLHSSFFIRWRMKMKNEESSGDTKMRVWGIPYPQKPWKALARTAFARRESRTRNCL